MKLGRMQRWALEHLGSFTFQSRGGGSSFGTPSGDLRITCRLMTSLVDRGWATVTPDAKYDVWTARITQSGRDALEQQ